jgi:protein TonB
MTSTTLSRLTGATTLGAAVTAAVLLLMQSLIDSDQPSLEDPPPGATLTYLRMIEEKPPEPDDPKPVEPPKPQPPPPPPTLTKHDPTSTVGTDFAAPDVETPISPGASTLSDGDALPVVKVRPVYPARAQQQGIEGYVLVQFSIDALGRVVDVQVIEAEPRGMFERAALKAVERFRYKPRVLNGEPTTVNGVQHLVTFELSS